MRELRGLRASAFENERVLVSVREMVLAADDVGDTQIDVVGTRGEVVGGHAVGTQKRKVFDVLSGLNLLAINGVIEADLFACSARNTEAEGEGFSRRSSAVTLGAGKFSHTRVKEPGLIGARVFAVSRMGWGEVAVS